MFLVMRGGEFGAAVIADSQSNLDEDAGEVHCAYRAYWGNAIWNNLQSGRKRACSALKLGDVSVNFLVVTWKTIIKIEKN